MLHVHIPNFLLRRHLLAVYHFHLSIMTRLLTVRHALVGARTMQLSREAAWSELKCETLSIADNFRSSLTDILVYYGRGDSPYLASAVNGPGKNSFTPLVQCTSHMCPVRVHWHVKLNYKEYWRVKIAITNFNYRMNYTQWNLVIQHPNLDNLTQLFSFNYKSLTPYGGISKFLRFNFTFLRPLWIFLLFVSWNC